MAQPIARPAEVPRQLTAESNQPVETTAHRMCDIADSVFAVGFYRCVRVACRLSILFCGAPRRRLAGFSVADAEIGKHAAPEEPVFAADM